MAQPCCPWISVPWKLRVVAVVIILVVIDLCDLKLQFSSHDVIRHRLDVMRILTIWLSAVHQIKVAVSQINATGPESTGSEP